MTRLATGAGSSRIAEAADAGRQAASAAMEGLGEVPAGLVIVYASIRYDFPALLAAIRAVTGDVPLVGASSAVQLLDGEYVPPGAGVVVMALGSGAYQFATRSVTGLLENGGEAGQRLAREVMSGVAEPRSPYGAFMVLAAGMAGNLEEFAVGIHRVVGAGVPLVGGTAAADHVFAGIRVFHGDQVIEDGAVGVWIGSDHPLKVVAQHGWEPCSLPLLVTKVEGQVVHELGGRPAMDVYEKDFREDPEHRVPEGFDPGYHSAHAFGLVQADGSFLVRGVNIQGDRLLTTVPLPAYSAVRVLSADASSLLDATEPIVAQALDGAPDPAVLLVFSCVSRADLFMERAPEEAKRIDTAAGSVSTFGFYTYGEFARTAGAGGYHNATITAVAL